MKPDFTSLRYYWIDGEVVLMSDLYNETNEKVQFAPREILRRQIENAEEMGFQIKVASELEFFVVKKSAKKNWDEKYKNLELIGRFPQDDNVLGDRNEDMVYAMRKALLHSGIKVETSKLETGVSQIEINTTYRKPMMMADEHIYYKMIVKHMAGKYDRCASFMAKPFIDQGGSGFHLHLNLTDKEGNNIFNGNDVLLCEKRKITASKNLIYFLGGWMKYILDVFPFYAPFVNSYKRFAKSSWAPSNLSSWTYDNRTSPFRIIGQGKSLRIEFRIPGADANPYLVFAASIACGLEGIAQKIEPPKMSRDNVYDHDNDLSPPKNLEEALINFESSEFNKKFLGEDVLKHYSNIYRIESNLYDRVVTDWEIKRYFDQA